MLPHVIVLLLDICYSCKFLTQTTWSKQEKKPILLLNRSEISCFDMKNVKGKKKSLDTNASNSLINIKMQNTVTTFTSLLLNFLSPEGFRVSITIKRMRDKKKGRSLKIAGLSHWSIIIDLLCYSLLWLFHYMLFGGEGGVLVWFFLQPLLSATNHKK